MQQEIKYTGITNTPSDTNAQDGQTTVMLNLIPEDGTVRPIPFPQIITNITPKPHIIYLHQTTAYKHYIVCDHTTQTLTYINHATPQTTHPIATMPTPIHSINSIGNTLVILCQDGIHYLLWKNQEYNSLGQKPPFQQLQFALSANHEATYDRSTIETTDNAKTYQAAWRATNINAPKAIKVASDGKTLTFKQEHLHEINQSIWALINQTNQLISKQGHFYAPFYVRYCYTLYDGTHYMHSAPILMPVSMPQTYQVEVANVTSNNQHILSIEDRLSVAEEKEQSNDFQLSTLAFRYRPSNVSLQCKTINNVLQTLKEDWADIVRSIDIFVSLPIIREDSSEKITTASIATTTYQLRADTLAIKTYPWRLSNDKNQICNVLADIPMLSEEAYIDKLCNVANFYKVYSYNLENDTIPSIPTDIPINKTVLTTLAQQPTMNDDYNTHTTFLPAYNTQYQHLTTIHNYNARLHIAGANLKLFAGYTMPALTPYCTSVQTPSITLQESQHIIAQHIFVYLKTQDGEKIVDCMSQQTLSPAFIPKLLLQSQPLFYPDSRAYKIEIYDGNKCYTLKMKPCLMLNGAMTIPTILNDNTQLIQSQTYNHLPQINDTIDATSKLFTSEINNPFFFPATGTHTIGTGIVLGVASAAKPLSEGQFGQYPLYAFTTQGVWALQLTQTGTYIARQPITRDVCINPKSITSIDSAVLFATDRGIMLLQGAQAICITDILNADSFLPISSLPYVHKLLKPLNINSEQFQIIPFIDYVKDSQTIYDYQNQRIILFNSKLSQQYPQAYAYIYSLKSKQWAMIQANITLSVNAYPEAIALLQNGDLVNFSQNTNQYPTALLITRPLTLQANNIYKTITTIIQRGLFKPNNIKLVLYASNDLWNWAIVWSSNDHKMVRLTGTPYKYFRIAILSNMKANETLAECTIEFKTKLTNRIR